MVLRKASAYSKHEDRAYTRKSRKPKINYVKAIPDSKIVKFTMGNIKKFQKNKFKYIIFLKSKENVQIRDNALEACRQFIHRSLDKAVGKANYFFRVNVYPHQALRENKILGIKKAERMQTGMKQSFGKVIGIAAKVKKGQTILTLALNNKDLAINFLKKTIPKLPCKTFISVEEVKTNL